jgi:hypothetical protein
VNVEYGRRINRELVKATNCRCVNKIDCLYWLTITWLVFGYPREKYAEKLREEKRKLEELSRRMEETIRQKHEEFEQIQKMDVADPLPDADVSKPSLRLVVLIHVQKV